MSIELKETSISQHPVLQSEILSPPDSDLSAQIEKAVSTQNVELLNEILDSMDIKTRRRILNNSAINGHPVLNYATLLGNTELVRYLLDNRVNPYLVNKKGRTALHEAVRLGHIDIVNILLNPNDIDEADGLPRTGFKRSSELSTDGIVVESVAALASMGTLINLTDQIGLTPLLLLTEASSLTPENFSTLVKLLLDHGATIDSVHPANGQNVLYRAVELQSLESCQNLMKAGISVDIQDTMGDTVLHVAAKTDAPNILEHLVQNSIKGPNMKNQKGETPLHCAAVAGSRECLNILLKNGGDLSVTNNEDDTVIDTILSFLPRPSSFLRDSLNSKVVSNGCDINDRRFQLTLDFSILSPDRDRQMAVVVALMNGIRRRDQNNVLSHPLLETYLRAKWDKMKAFFFALFFVHLLFVVALSTHVILNLNKHDESAINWSRRILLIMAVTLTIHVMVQTYMAPRYFLHEAETWLSFTCVSLAFVVALSGEIVPDAKNTEWMRHVASFTVLLAWGQIMFTLGRFPSVGFFALMFFTVLRNVMKVLLISACLVIGFALSFCIQMNFFEYDGFWRSFVRTTVMLMGEYQYDSLFPPQEEDIPKQRMRWDDKPTHLHGTSQIIFLLFILLGSVVLVNLMTGLAVSDIQALQMEGNLRHVMKQAEFLLHMENILSLSGLLKVNKMTPTILIVNPNSNMKMQQSLGLNIPSSVMENLINIALKNERRNSDFSSSRSTDRNSLLSQRIIRCSAENEDLNNSIREHNDDYPQVIIESGRFSDGFETKEVV